MWHENPPGKMRIQVSPRWTTSPNKTAKHKDKPIASWSKILALLGCLAFWLFFWGVIGDSSRAAMRYGFWLFLASQVPMLWLWIRKQQAKLKARRI